MKQARTDYFISYTSVDQPWAEWIAWVLETTGYHTQLQAWDFVPGSMFPVDMHEAISSSKFTVAVLTPQYLESRYARAEWSAALALDRLIPVRVADFVPEGLFAGRTYIDLVGLQEVEAREALVRGVELASCNLQRDGSLSSHHGRRTIASQVAPAFPGHNVTPADLSRQANLQVAALSTPSSSRHPANMTRPAPTGARRFAVDFWLACGGLVLAAIAVAVVSSSETRREYARSATPLPSLRPPSLAVPIGMKLVSGGTLRTDPPSQPRPRGCSSLNSESDCSALCYQEQRLTVDVDSFYLDVTEVTNEMFADWISSYRERWRMSDTESDVLVLSDESGTPLVWLGAACSGTFIDRSQSIRIRSGCARRPVTCVSWHGAREYCRARGNRLPTDHEWLWAARGPENRVFPWGPSLPSPDAVVFGLKGSVHAGPRDIDTGVDDITPEGIRNLGGNVAEWTEDGPVSGEKIVRGGSWASATACQLLNFCCSGVPPNNHSATDLGFRCARSVSP